MNANVQLPLLRVCVHREVPCAIADYCRDPLWALASPVRDVYVDYQHVVVVYSC